MQILKQAENGVPVPGLCREHGMSSATLYSWRSKYGGMDASLISQMKALAAENARIERMYAEVSMQNDLLEDALKKVTRAYNSKELAKQAVSKKQSSIRPACATFGISETCYRYERRLNEEKRRDCDLAALLDEEAQAVGL